MNRTIVIVCACLASLSLAEALRSDGPEGPIALVGAEAEAPYQRPPLSKGFLLDTAGADQLAMRPAGAPEKMRPTWCWSVSASFPTTSLHAPPGWK